LATTLPQLSVTIYSYRDNLQPDGLTELLGTKPSKAWPKGSTISHQQASSHAIAKTGFWMLRISSPNLGRHTQPDPLGFVGGPSVYGYARSNPQDRTSARCNVRDCRPACIGAISQGLGCSSGPRDDRGECSR